MEEIKVSVLCAAYNHEQYIRQCLEGFVMQKTNFKFEVLINDDASTDNTAKIIREYEEKYPDIIKPIYQTENQYSKGVKIVRQFLFPKAQGKYFAFCEGDDCWIDENKLQIQYDFLENHKNFSASSHRTVIEYFGAAGVSVVPQCKRDKHISFKNIVFEGMIETSSFFLRRNIYEELPEQFKAKTFGDHQLFLHAAACGKIKCFYNIMSLYRKGHPGSWSDKMKSEEAKYLFYCEHIELIQKMMKYYTNKKNIRVLKKRKNFLETLNFIYKNDERLKQQPYKKIYRKLKIKEKRKKIKKRIGAFIKRRKCLFTIWKKLRPNRNIDIDIIKGPNNE